MSGRSLTYGEQEILEKVFYDSINPMPYIYNEYEVEIRSLPFDIQFDNTVVSPDGNIYATGDKYCRDYSDTGYIGHKALFVHELTHVWQYQNKQYLNMETRTFSEFLSEGFDSEKAYPFKLEYGKDLLDYDIEQQASIIELYYLIIYENWDIKLFRERAWYKNRILNTESSYEVMKLFHSVLECFMENPGYVKKTKLFTVE